MSDTSQTTQVPTSFVEAAEGLVKQWHDDDMFDGGLLNVVELKLADALAALPEMESLFVGKSSETNSSNTAIKNEGLEDSGSLRPERSADQRELLVVLEGELTRGGCGIGGVHLTGEFVEPFLDDCFGQPTPTQVPDVLSYGRVHVQFLRDGDGGSQRLIPGSRPPLEPTEIDPDLAAQAIAAANQPDHKTAGAGGLRSLEMIEALAAGKTSDPHATLALVADALADFNKHAATPSTAGAGSVAGDGGGWQPIETAPKDGQIILLSDGRYVDEGFWYIDTDSAYKWRSTGIYEGSGEWYEIEAPTHWRERISPPANDSPAQADLHTEGGQS